MAFSVPSQALNYHPDFEAAVQSQIQLQLHASYVYLFMAFYCYHHDVALEHLAGFFLRRSHKWKVHSEKLLELQNQRSGSIRLHETTKPDHDAWHSGLQAMECAFHLDKSVNESILKLYHLATERSDLHSLQLHYLHQQVLIICELGSYLTNLRRIQALEDPMAEILFDWLTLGRSYKDN